ncbi:hypothetical protein ACQEVF_01660 [Nonomuraea polychroma]|uniref:hypothetical protein n=1 Tax=Nonomuraea polychroma TaxID=46176 RepID=UPI003D8BD362
MTDDDRLEADLRRAADIMDPVPAHLIQSAVDAFSLSTLDDELAELAFDSLAEPAAPVRSGGGTRLVGFTTGAVRIELELTTGDDSCRILGRLTPPQPADIEVQQRHTRTDALGRFSYDGLARGPFILRCRLPHMLIVTEWITI